MAGVRKPFIVIPVALGGPLPTVNQLRALESLPPAFIVQPSLHARYAAEDVKSYNQYLDGMRGRRGGMADRCDEGSYRTLAALDDRGSGMSPLEIVQSAALLNPARMPVVMAFEDQINRLLDSPAGMPVRAGHAYAVLSGQPLMIYRLSRSPVFCDAELVRDLCRP